MQISLIPIVLSLLFWSCSTSYTIEQVIGTYYYSDCNYCCITIKPSGEFSYVLKDHMSYFESTGKWSLVGDNIILNSFKHHGIVSVKESRTLSDSINIIVNDTLGDPLIGGVTLNADSHVGFNYKDSNGVSFPRQNLSSFTIGYFNTKYRYTVIDTASNRFIVKVVFKDPSYMYFDNEKWKLKDAVTLEDDRGNLLNQGFPK